MKIHGKVRQSEVKAGLAIKNPPKKTCPIKPKKNRLKNPPQIGFFGFYWVF
jgi:hypothetical protein